MNRRRPNAGSNSDFNKLDVCLMRTISPDAAACQGSESRHEPGAEGWILPTVALVDSWENCNPFLESNVVHVIRKEFRSRHTNPCWMKKHENKNWGTLRRTRVRIVFGNAKTVDIKRRNAMQRRILRKRMHQSMRRGKNAIKFLSLSLARCPHSTGHLICETQTKNKHNCSSPPRNVIHAARHANQKIVCENRKQWAQLMGQSPNKKPEC